MNKWLELISEKRDEILEAGKKAYREAIENTHLRFIVEMDEDGKISTWYDVAGGNSFHESTFKGRSIELLHFCFQYYMPEYTKEEIRNKFEDKSLLSIFEQIEAEAEENFSDVENEIRMNHEEFVYILEECKQEAIDFEIEELSPEYVEQQLDQMISDMEDMEV